MNNFRFSKKNVKIQFHILVIYVSQSTRRESSAYRRFLIKYENAQILKICAIHFITNSVLYEPHRSPKIPKNIQLKIPHT